MTVDYTTVIGQNLKNNEASRREEINNLAAWCTENNLQQTLTKPDALLVLRKRKKRRQRHTSLSSLSGAEVKKIKTVFGSWGSASQRTCHGQSRISMLVKKAQTAVFLQDAVFFVKVYRATKQHGMCTCLVPIY